MKKLLFLVNAHAGRADIRHRLLDVLDIFTKAGFLVSCMITQHAGHATELARDLGGLYDHVVCSGGDGTVNETLNGLMRLKENRPTFGILPAGTTNDYAHSLSIPSDAKKAADIAVNGFPFAIDIGSLNELYFSYVSAFGLFTDVTYQTNQDTKNILGGVAYVLEGAKRVSSIQEYAIRLEHDNGVLEGNYIIGLFSNSISVAGMRTLYKGALLDDGKLEICLLKPPKNLSEVQDILNILISNKSATEIDNEFMTIVHTQKAVVRSVESIDWNVDGENAGAHQVVEIRAHRQAVTVMAGRDMKENSVAERDSLSRNPYDPAQPAPRDM